MGTSLLYAQLQEAIRMAKVFESCSGLTMRPKRFCQQFGVTCYICVQYFNAVRAPLKFETF